MTARFRREGCVAMKALPFVLLLLLASFPRFCFAWTGPKWLGIVEAVGGAAVIRLSNTPSSEVCDNCGGTGRLGDGTVSVECPLCEGTGKPVKPGKVFSSPSFQQDCASCASPATIQINPSPPGTDAPAEKQEAKNIGGGTYKRRLLWRR